MIQRELAIDSTQIEHVMREALKLLPLGVGNVRLYINPQDFEQVKALRERHEETWRIVEDEALLPGGCRVETEHSRIDATVETRVARVMDKLFDQLHEQALAPGRAGPEPGTADRRQACGRAGNRMLPMRLDRTSFAKRLGSYAEATELAGAPILEGRLLRMVGLTLEAEGLRAAMGSRCMVINDDSYHPVQVEAEVMGFSGSKVFLMPVGSVAGIAPGARVVPLADTGRLPMGMSMLGRVLDGAGRALDGKGGMKAEDWVPMDGPTINPLKREPISEPLDVGIRCINGLLTVGRGQRLGLFAGTGVGKVRAAGHDDPLHRGRHHRRRADR